MKNYKTGLCSNCGADSGLHHFDTQQCPRNGIEETRFDKLEGKFYPQKWSSTTFEDSGIKKLNDAAPEMLEALIEIAKGKGRYDLDKLKHCGNTVEDMMELANEAIKKATLNENTGPQEQANLKKLPEWCFGLHQTTQLMVRIDKGISGCSPVRDEDIPVKRDDNPEESFNELIDRWNEKIGVTPGQRQAMTFGSMFGWHLPLADPDMYDEKGDIITSKL